MRHVFLLLLAVISCWAGEAVVAPPTYDEVVIGNERIRVAISTLRGSIRRVELLDSKPIILPRHARNGPNALPDGPLPVLRAFMSNGNHNWVFSDNGGLTAAAWRVLEKGADHAALGFTTDNGLDWRMDYRLAPQSLEIGVQLSVANHGDKPAPLELHVFPVVGVHADHAQSEIGYQSVFSHSGGIAGTITNHGMPAIAANTPDTVLGGGGAVDYIGVKSRYFATWWKPAGVVEATAPAKPVAAPQGLDGMAQSAQTPAAAAAPAADWQAFARGFTGQDGVQQALVRISYAKTEIVPGATWQRGWSITAASMTKADLALLPEAERMIKYTDGYYRFFKILANALTWVLDLLAGVVGHYGIAVILLTVLIKAALHRTSFKQQESMLKMQKVAPELKYLQEQYKNNKQMLAQKQMELFKKHGVNPLGGCLPIFIQLPIFIALFQAFSHSADLRGTSFLWISDLTLPDQTFGLQTLWWPFWGGVISLNILPIIYIGVSAWMSFSQTPPANADPQQEMMYKMMRWLPVFFGVIFYNMPSGLVLYFTIQAVISTLELKYIKRKLGMK